MIKEGDHIYSERYGNIKNKDNNCFQLSMSKEFKCSELEIRNKTAKEMIRNSGLYTNYEGSIMEVGCGDPDSNYLEDLLKVDKTKRKFKSKS